jgi:hypothetical protein
MLIKIFFYKKSNNLNPVEIVIFSINSSFHMNVFL